MQVSRFLFVPAIFLIVLCCSSSIFAAESKTDAEWSRTVEVAKKEGKVSVFLYQRENTETAIKAFEKKYPDIQVVTASTPAAETGPRLMAERRAGKFLWDICICGPTTPYTILYPAKALDPKLLKEIIKTK
jgi:ABC-type glycerol-3-phosphate transport system substrate-binding protein